MPAVCASHKSTATSTSFCSMLRGFEAISDASVVKARCSSANLDVRWGRLSNSGLMSTISRLTSAVSGGGDNSSGCRAGHHLASVNRYDEASDENAERSSFGRLRAGSRFSHAPGKNSHCVGSPARPPAESPRAEYRRRRLRLGPASPRQRRGGRHQFDGIESASTNGPRSHYPWRARGLPTVQTLATTSVRLAPEAAPTRQFALLGGAAFIALASGRVPPAVVIILSACVGPFLVSTRTTNIAGYANKCRSKLCRNCVRSPRKRRQTATFTGSHREAFCGGKSLNRLREEMFRYHSVQLAGVVFQACSFNHSDISPCL